MSTFKRGFRFANVVSVIALFVALSGGAYAAIKLPANSVKAKNIKAGAVKTGKIADGAITTQKFAGDAIAPNAARLGGVLPSGYQEFCEAGAIKGSLVFDVSALPDNGPYVTQPGFNCNGGIVQIRKTAAAGDYRIRFSPNPGTGSAVVSTAADAQQIGTRTRTDDPLAPGETVFQVTTANAAGAPTDGDLITLLAF
jgi:hypothetical protein